MIYHMHIRPSLFIAFLILSRSVNADEIFEFNKSFISPELSKQIDLTKFTQAYYVYPGEYEMSVMLNSEDVGREVIKFVENPDFNSGRQTGACLSPELIQRFNLTRQANNTVAWKGHCLDYSSLAGIRVTPDMGKMQLNIILPQAYIEYSSNYWDPPSRWDNGVSGALLDYNLIAKINKKIPSNEIDGGISGYGVAGINVGAWRLRSDWQADWNAYDFKNHNSAQYTSSGAINRVYAYRAMPDWQAQLRLGEDYMSSNLFSGFRFIGLSLASDERMLPPNIRGYSPEVTGVAKSDAKVIVSQHGRVLHEEQVVAGPFRINNIQSSVRGLLDVRVEEQDGQVQTFQVNSINAPYLSREGRIRYHLSAGRPATVKHSPNGSAFISADASMGLTNNLSILGGIQTSQDYLSTVGGVGVDLLQWGAVSLQRYDSWVQLDNERLAGTSYSLNYSKEFEPLNSTLSLAGYRYSDQNYMGMEHFLSALDEPSSYNDLHSEKDSFTASISTRIPIVDGSSYISIDRNRYYDGTKSNRYNLSFSKSFSFASLKYINATLSLYKSESNDSFNRSDKGGYLSLSFPLGGGSTNYMANISHGKVSHSLGYSESLDDANRYSITTGKDAGNSASFNGSYTHTASGYELNSALGYKPDNYASLSLGLRGGMTATVNGAALHRADRPGGTRVMVDAAGIPDVPIKASGRGVTTNMFGSAVTTDISEYYRQRIDVEVARLPEGVDVESSVHEKTYTEGAIGYWHVGGRSGDHSMVEIVKGKGYPPFGASVLNEEGIEVGIVGYEGGAYLTGLHPGEQLHVRWAGAVRCDMELPKALSDMMSLQCHA
ncbi:TPA: fimbria/pilus outer membrane usher protein [Aeromonas veronii]|nr:fimbria/pilus outer membrane usher protein [Aeromonas veronii]